MKLAAARAIVDRVLESELESESIFPWAFTGSIADQVAEAVKSVANKEA